MELISSWSNLKIYLLGVGTGTGIIMFLLGVFARIALSKIKRYDGYEKQIEDIDIKIVRIETRCEEREHHHHKRI